MVIVVIHFDSPKFTGQMAKNFLKTFYPKIYLDIVIVGFLSTSKSHFSPGLWNSLQELL